MEGVKSLPEAVYQAEDLSLSDITRQFPRFVDVERFVESVTTSEWWSTNFPTAPIKVFVEQRSNSARFAVATKHAVAIPNSQTGRTTATVLHELAHVATHSVDGHGPIFRSAMLKLVRHYMGFNAFVDLETAYRTTIK